MTRHYASDIVFSGAVIALLLTPLAMAQELTMPPTTTMGQPTVVETIPAGPEQVGPTPILDEPGFSDGLFPHPGYDSYREFDNCNTDMWGARPALTESTGTWLRRGWWYTEIDAVVLNRQWRRDDMVIGADTSALRRLHLNRTDPGASSSVRLTLGRFLFRDVRNRDHTLEFTSFGGGESQQDDTLTSSTGGQTLIVPNGISLFNPTFDGAESMDVYYDSRFTSFELNYRVKERMSRDRMLLTPNGEWVRTANQGVTKQFLAGLRYFDMVDVLNWNATNISSLGNNNGAYDVRTNNDMFGLQLGCSLLFEHDRWNLELLGKGGPYVNDAKSRARLAIENDPDTSFVVNNRESSLAFVGEFQLIGRYHLRPNVSLRAGWQMMYITSVALAPDQADFNPDEGRFAYTGDPFYNGAIFGLECYW